MLPLDELLYNIVAEGVADDLAHLLHISPPHLLHVSLHTLGCLKGLDLLTISIQIYTKLNKRKAFRTWGLIG